METLTFTPNSRYKGKLVLIMMIIAVLVMIGGFLLSWPIGLDEGPRAARTCILVFFLVDIGWLIPALLLVGPYFRSLRYEIHDDEIIVHVGIWTKSVKHVPFRTVTNLKVNRDILDRWLFDIGSLNVQTAGMSGKTGAEESLVGLPNVQEIYDIVSSRLRQFRGGMAPTAAGEEAPPSSGTMEALLTEVRAIRKAVEK
jgi:uncharacterized membrane protein YdbT with pleckstrin-like domain